MVDIPDLKSVATKVACEFDSRLPHTLLRKVLQNIKIIGECYIWTGAVTQSNGYGKIKYEGKCWDIHRLIGKYLFRNLQRRNDICHINECNSRACIRPKHLYKGTRASNMQDAIKKGTFRGYPALPIKELV